MIKNIYLEKSISKNRVALDIIKRLQPKNLIYCQNYREVFNKKSQNFKLQKIQPSLILAKKKGNILNKIPEKYGIGSKQNYYFSHMLNCIYDCRYCFLQGMFNSANYVVFINYRDFFNEIKKIAKLTDESIHIFSGYDCDSLALEPITNFFSICMEKLSIPKNILIELRTKSTQINFLMKRRPSRNYLIAFTLNPEDIVSEYECKTPSLYKRLESIKRLNSNGWKIGLRFDPILITKNFRILYKNFFHFVFSYLEKIEIHSITIGSFRMPYNYYKEIIKIHPNEKILFSNIEKSKKDVSYTQNLKEDALIFAKKEILKYASNEILFVNKN